MNDIRQEIKSKLFTVTGKVSPAKIKQHKELWNSIISLTSFLPIISPFAERIYCVLNDITAPVLCPFTGYSVKWSAQRKGYRTAVGSTNSLKLVDKKKSVKKFKETIERIHKENREFIKTSYMNNDYMLMNKEDVKKIAIEMINSSTSNYFTPSCYRKKKDLICSIVYYTDNGYIKGNIGCNWGERLYLIKNDIDRPPHCVDDTSKKQFFENTMKGYRNYSTNKNRIVSHMKEDVIPEIEKQGFSIVGGSIEYIKEQIFELRCNKCDTVHTRRLFNGAWQNIYCPGCFGATGRSKIEEDVYQYIRSIYSDEIVCNYEYTNRGKEIDIFLPEKKIGIEINGILWHSYGATYPNNIESYNKKYHLLSKYDELKQMNIKIINVFDIEWENKPEIIKSILAAKINVFKEKIYARKCSIKEIDSQTSAEFLDNNHLQGRDKSKYRIGLYYNNELYSVMTFSNRSITGGNTSLELVRFCNKLHTSVVGGASRLFQYFISKYLPSNVITYADKRFSDGGLYNHLGFNLVRESNPNYFYMKHNNLESRMKYQKHKLQNILPIYDANKTELQNMWDNDYRILYDCGNLVFKWNRGEQDVNIQNYDTMHYTKREL